MNSAATPISTRNYLPLTIAMITCLILLINVSFKIVMVEGIVFTANSVLCPLIAVLYFVVLKECNPDQQRQVLNQALMALYLFSIGIFLLVNLPSVGSLRANDAYQIIFEDIPRKFFASTLAFGLGFYLPYLYCRAKKRDILQQPERCLILSMFGGFFFFSIDFFFLFADPQAENFFQIYIDSLMVSTTILLLFGLGYLTWSLRKKPSERKLTVKPMALCYKNSFYHYLVVFSAIILLICLACEYRLILIANGWTIVAGVILFPLNIMVSNIVGELYGYKANMRKTGILLVTELVFDMGLMISVLLPSPDFFDLNPFYSCIIPRRVSVTIMVLFLALGCNALLLEKLKKTIYGSHRALRIFVANMISNSLLCLINYTILFSGIYPYEQIFNLSLSSWTYQFVATIIFLPVTLWLLEAFRSYTVTDEKAIFVEAATQS